MRHELNAGRRRPWVADTTLPIFGYREVDIRNWLAVHSVSEALLETSWLVQPDQFL